MATSSQISVLLRGGCPGCEPQGSAGHRRGCEDVGLQSHVQEWESTQRRYDERGGPTSAGSGCTIWEPLLSAKVSTMQKVRSLQGLLVPHRSPRSVEMRRAVQASRQAWGCQDCDGPLT